MNLENDTPVQLFIDDVITIKHWSELFTAIQVVPLCTDPDPKARLRGASKLRVLEHGYFILDNEAIDRRLFMFNRDGKVLAYREGIQEGSKNLYSVNDVFVYGGAPYVVDAHANAILELDRDLNVVGETMGPPGNNAMNAARLPTNGELVVRPELSPAPTSSLLFREMSEDADVLPEYTVKNDFRGVAGQKPVYFPLTGHENFSTSADKRSLLYHDIFQPSIWKITKNDVVLEYEIKFPVDVWLQTEDRIKVAELYLPDGLDYLKSTGTAYIFDAIYDSPESLIVVMRQANQFKNFIFYNKKNKKANAYRIRLAEENLDSSYSRLLKNPVGFENGQLIFDVSIEELAAFYQRKNDELPNRQAVLEAVKKVECTRALVYLKQLQTTSRQSRINFKL